MYSVFFWEVKNQMFLSYSCFGLYMHDLHLHRARHIWVCCQLIASCDLQPFLVFFFHLVLITMDVFSMCFPWLGTMSCFGIQNCWERGCWSWQSVSFSCNVVPKHIGEVGMWIIHVCDMHGFIEVTPSPQPPLTLECVSFLG